MACEASSYRGHTVDINTSVLYEGLSDRQQVKTHASLLGGYMLFTRQEILENCFYLPLTSSYSVCFNFYPKVKK